MQSIKWLIISFFIFIALDSMWLAWLAKPLYLEAYKPWLRMEAGGLLPVWWAAILVYVLFAIAIVFLVLPLAQGSLLSALKYGALLGLVTYGIYDFTCLAIFRDWPVSMSFIDWAWGTVLCAVASFLTAYTIRLLG